MKRAAIAIAWLLGTGVSAVVGAVFLFGCCVLPLHAYLHRAVPLCAFAIHVAQHDDAQPASPAHEKQEPMKRVASRVTSCAFDVDAPLVAQRVAAGNARAYRSFIAHGALRCDRDVGLHLLAGTLLI
ncbi:MAG: hypothetical protein JO197_17705 [Acidobacteria bacterium]|nr:hypothetical protein [Acidobacteriota bacterium]MBV9478940.1 hypothetical protein [Acidobacteriota bacterium]